MATMVITHLGVGGDLAGKVQSDIQLSELAVPLHYGKPITVDRSVPDISRMKQLISKAGAVTPLVSVAVTLSAAELASGLALPPNVVNADDVAAVASTALLGVPFLIRKALASGGAGGTADDTTLIAAGALPRKLRIVDAWAFVGTGVAASMTLRDQAAGAGSALATINMTSTGRVQTSTGDALATPGATIGLFLNRADRNSVLTFFALVRPET